MVRIFYFARIREQLGCSEEYLILPSDINTFSALINYLAQRGGVWYKVFSENPTLLMALNHTLASPNTLLKDEDEVAFFPPVTGG